MQEAEQNNYPQQIAADILGKSAFVVVAAGRGGRAGQGLPKQYRTVSGKMLLTHTLNAIQRHSKDAIIIPVIHPNDVDLYEKATENLSESLSENFSGLASPVFGGTERQESVFLGLQAIKTINSDCQYVFVHDAARPFVTADIILSLCDGLSTGKTKGVIPTIAVVDTLVRSDQGANILMDNVPREQLHQVQTPQAFDFKTLYAAHTTHQHRMDFTDDASVLRAEGFEVSLCRGSIHNIKITTPQDFIQAEMMMMQQLGDIRTGQGYDVHRFKNGDHLWLCGIKIDHDKALRGHSDADVGLHALTDALLSSISDGDIGSHFPPSDKQWRGASSAVFLSHAAKRINDIGGMIAHVAVTLICEAPKIATYSLKMRQRIADILQIDIKRVSVQATTTEKLGFTGRGEGIAASATATVRLPWDRT